MNGRLADWARNWFPCQIMPTVLPRNCKVKVSLLATGAKIADHRGKRSFQDIAAVSLRHGCNTDTGSTRQSLIKVSGGNCNDGHLLGKVAVPHEAPPRVARVVSSISAMCAFKEVHHGRQRGDCIAGCCGLRRGVERRLCGTQRGVECRLCGIQRGLACRRQCRRAGRSSA